jgi:hypothetical protein
MRIVKIVVGILFFSVSNLHAQAYPNAKTGGNYMHNYYFPPAEHRGFKRSTASIAAPFRGFRDVA